MSLFACDAVMPVHFSIAAKPCEDVRNILKDDFHFVSMSANQFKISLLTFLTHAAVIALVVEAAVVKLTYVFSEIAAGP